MFYEAEQRGDKETAIAIMGKLQETQTAPEPSPETTFTPQDKSFLDRVQEKYTARGVEVTESILDYMSDDLTANELMVQTVGKGVAGSFMDLAGETISQSLSGLRLLIPDAVADATKQGMIKAWDTVANTEVGEAAINAAEKGIKAYDEWSKENPRAAKDVESVVNIGMLVAPAKVKKNAPPGFLSKVSDSTVGKTARALEASAAKTIAKRKTKYLDTLLTPKQTAKVRTSQVAQTEEVGKGLLARSVVKKTPHQEAIAKEVAKVKALKPGMSLQKSYEEISKVNLGLAKKLERDVAKEKIILSRNSTNEVVDKAVSDLIASNPVVTGEAANIANKVATKAKQLIDQNPPNPAGLLKARKDLDAWILKQKGDAIFDPALENSLTHSTRAVRTAMNDALDASVKSTAVKEELKRQSLLFDAMDVIRPKAADEANTWVMRAWQNAAAVLPFQRKATQEVGLLLGLTSFGAASTFAPYFQAAALGTGATYGTYRIASSPAARKGIAKILNLTDQAIKVSTNKEMLKQLRADRMFLVELLKNDELEQEQQGER